MADTAQNKPEDRIASLQQEAEETLRSKTLVQRALYRITHDYLTMSALGVIALLAIVSYAAPLIVAWFLDIEYNRQDPFNNRLPPGSTVVDSNTTVGQWLVETGEFRRSIDGHTQPVTALDVSPEGDVVVSISEDGSVRVRLVFSGRVKRTLDFPEDVDTVYTAVDYAPSGEAFVVGDSAGIVTTWVPEKDHPTDPDIPLVEIEAHEGEVTGVAYSPDGAYLLSGGADGTAKLWDATSGDQLFLREVGSPVTDVAFSPDGALFITADESGAVHFWAADTGESLRTIDLGSPTNRDLLSATDESGAVIVVDLTEPLRTLEVGAAVNRARFSADGAQILTAGEGGSAILWDVESGDDLLTLSHPDAVNSAYFTPDGSAILTSSDDGAARLWDIETGELILSFDDFEYPMLDAVMSHDGETILTATAGRPRHYILGTDRAGRDHLSRLMYAGQISLRIGIFSAVGALTLGVVVGVTAGYFGGRLDDFVMWVITTLNSIPSLYLLLIVSALLAPNANSLILVLVVLSWTGSARIVRGETFSIRERDYVMAARAIGASDLRIMFAHIVPNVISLLLIVLSRLIGGLILVESALSFLGFGVKPPTPTWGNMLSADLDLLRDAPHLVFVPGILITITVLCLYIIGDGMRDAFDPNIAD